MADPSQAQRLALARVRAEAQQRLNAAKGIGAHIKSDALQFLAGVGDIIPPPFSTRPSEVRLDLPSNIPEDAPWWVPRKDYTSAAFIAAREALQGPAQRNPPVTMAQQMTGRIARQFGINLPWAGIPLGQGFARARQGLPFLKAFVRPMGTEVGFATAMGAGAGVANLIAPGSQGADALGQLGGAVVAGGTAIGGKYSILGMSLRAGRAVKARFGAAGRRTASESTVGKLIGGIPEEDLARWETEQLRGTQFTLAETTGRPDLLAAQARIEASMRGPEATAQRARRAANEAAINEFAEGAAPMVRSGLDATPRFVIDTATNNITDIRKGIGGDIDDILQGGRQLAASTQAQTGRAQQTLGRQQDVVTTRQEELAATLPEPSRDVLGAGMREAFIAEERGARDAMQTRIRELNLDNVKMFVPFANFRRSVSIAFKPGRLSDKSNTPDAVDRILNAKGSITFGDLMDLRRDLGNEIRMLSSGQNANPMKRGLAQKLRDMLDRNLLGEDAATGFGEQGANYRTFRREYFEKIIEPFENNSVYKVTQANGRSFYTTADENLAGLFFRKGPGAITAAKEYRRVFGDNQEMTDAIVTTALDSLRAYAVRGGVIDPKRMTAWTREHKAILGVFPGLTGSIRNIDNVNTALVTRADQLRQREQQIQDASLSRSMRQEGRVGAEVENLQGDLKLLGQDPFVKTLGSKATPDARIVSATTNPAEMRGLLNSLDGDVDAIDSLRRQIWNRVDAQDPAAVAGFISKNSESLVQLFGIQHLSDLQRIADLRITAARVPEAIGTAALEVGAGWFQRMFGQSFASASVAATSLARGRTQPQWEAAMAAGRFFRGRSQVELDNVLSAVLYDPEVARNLAAAAADPKKVEPTLRWVRGWMLGGTLNFALSEEEE